MATRKKKPEDGAKPVVLPTEKQCRDCLDALSIILEASKFIEDKMGPFTPNYRPAYSHYERLKTHAIAEYAKEIRRDVEMILGRIVHRSEEVSLFATLMKVKCSK